MNDGPGFCRDVLDVSALDPIRSRIRIIQPEYCVIGRIFEPEVPDHTIVRSSVDGIMAHQMGSWGNRSPHSAEGGTLSGWKRLCFAGPG